MALLGLLVRDAATDVSAVDGVRLVEDALRHAAREGDEAEAAAPAVAVSLERGLAGPSEGTEIVLQVAISRRLAQSADKNPVDLNKLAI